METPPPINQLNNKKTRPTTSKPRPVTANPNKLKLSANENQISMKNRPASSMKMQIKRPISNIQSKNIIRKDRRLWQQHSMNRLE